MNKNSIRYNRRSKSKTYRKSKRPRKSKKQRTSKRRVKHNRKSRKGGVFYNKCNGFNIKDLENDDETVESLHTLYQQCCPTVNLGFTRVKNKTSLCKAIDNRAQYLNTNEIADDNQVYMPVGTDIERVPSKQDVIEQKTLATLNPITTPIASAQKKLALATSKTINAIGNSKTAKAISNFGTSVKNTTSKLFSKKPATINRSYIYGDKTPYVYNDSDSDSDTTNTSNTNA